MKKCFFLVSMIVMLLVLAACNTSRPENVGLLDMDKVLRISKRAQELQNELIDIGNKLEAEYRKKEEKLSGEEGKEELDRIYEEYVYNKQRLERTLNQELSETIAEISREEKLEIVVYNEIVYYGGVDITDKVITRLDDKYFESGDSDSE
ncbi:MAG: OmpH family outer membrane protein [Halanaerobiaceae bacterium]|nr:OmpH family outer membrane protein [Halanaerobiaceae bacterium]